MQMNSFQLILHQSNMLQLPIGFLKHVNILWLSVIHTIIAEHISGGSEWRIYFNDVHTYVRDHHDQECH